MPITYSFVHDAIWLKVRGGPLFQEFSESIHQAMADEEFLEGMPLVLDLQYFTRSPSSADIRARVVFLKAHAEKISSTVVIIVSSTLHYGLSRMFEIQAEQNGLEVEIFKDEDKACEWLQTLTQKTRGKLATQAEAL